MVNRNLDNLRVPNTENSISHDAILFDNARVSVEQGVLP